MTYFLEDILRQPEELRRAIEHLTGPAGAGRGALEAATAAVRGARSVYLTGIGSSWHDALKVSALFHAKNEKMKQTGGPPSTVLFCRTRGRKKNMKKLNEAAERMATGAHVHSAAGQSQSHAGENPTAGSLVFFTLRED